MDLKEFKQIKSRNIKRHPWELTRWKILNFFISNNKERSLILDLGSGDAFLSSEIAKHNVNSTVVAVDINYTNEIVNELKNGQPSNLHFLKDISLLNTKPKIDIVLLMDVLEHLEAPDSLLRQVRSLPSITTGTIFIITVPAYQFLFSHHDTELGHYKRYTIRTLNELLHAQSLKVSNTGYCFISLILIRLLQILRSKISGSSKWQRDGLHNWTGKKWLTAFITNLLWFEFKISWYLARIGIKLPGLTCYSICQPSPS